MAMDSLAIAPGTLDRIFAQGVLTGLSDDRLLDRFLADGDGDAFAALVARHGPMVLRVGLSTLANPSDAEDAFQATFLILVRRASSLRGRPDLGGWLFRVAHRVSLRANAVAARRRAKEQAAARMAATISSDDPAPPDDLAPALHEAIAGLPESLRSAIFLCDLRDIPQRDAALALRTSERTLRRRLAQARDRLRARLSRQGLTLEAAALATRSRDAATVVPPSWSDAVVSAAVSRAVATVSARALSGGLFGDRTSRVIGFAAVGIATVAMTTWIGLVAVAAPPQEPRATPRATAKAAAATSKDTEPENAPVTVYGKAIDEQGNPVGGATVYLMSSNGIDAPLGTAITAADGSYRFADARLPIKREREAWPWGSIQVFATAPGHGFAWHGKRYYSPRPRPVGVAARIDRSFEGEPIVMDLTFPRQSFLAGRIVDEARRPVSGAEVRLQQCDYLDIKVNDPHVSVSEFQPSCGALTSMLTTRTDEDGRFRLSGLPAERGFWIQVQHRNHALQSVFAATTERPATSFEYPRESVHHWITPPPARTGPLLIVLGTVRRIAVRTVLAETGKVATGVKVHACQGAYSIQASGTSDVDGQLELRLPPGQYDLSAVPTAGGSECVRTGSTLRVTAEPAEQRFEYTVRTGSVVNFDVVDAETGKGLPGVGVWCIKGCDLNLGSISSHTGANDDPVTGANGRLRSVLCPGDQVFSIIKLPPSLPYQLPDQPRRVTLRPGETATVRFELRRAN